MLAFRDAGCDRRGRSPARLEVSHMSETKQPVRQLSAAELFKQALQAGLIDEATYEASVNAPAVELAKPFVDSKTGRSYAMVNIQFRDARPFKLSFSKAYRIASNGGVLTSILDGLKADAGDGADSDADD